MRYTVPASDTREFVLGKPGNTGIKRILNATVYSWLGLSAAWKNESAFRQELVLAVVLLPLAIWLGQTALERALLIACLLVVLIVELLNSAIEAAIDRHGDERHILSGRAKDLGSAAVFVSLALVVVVWGLIAAERLLGAAAT